MPDKEVYCIAGNTIGRKPGNGGHGIGCQRELSYTLTTADRHVVAIPENGQKMAGRGKAAILNDQGGSYLAVEHSGLSPTLRGQPHGNLPVVAFDGMARRLTPLECERLQGFPDGWTRYRHDGKETGDTRRYEMLGNSIAVPCAAYIMQGMRQVLDGTF